VVDIASVSLGEGVFGYWFDRAAWGLGYATEATRAIAKFAFDDLKLSQLRGQRGLRPRVAEAGVPAGRQHSSVVAIKRRGNHRASISAQAITKRPN
jgi:[ribosomal protein S5]-alanine N-acetyltransferase